MKVGDNIVHALNERILGACACNACHAEVIIKMEGGSHEDDETEHLSYVAGGMFSDAGDECCNGGYHWKVSSSEASTTVAEFFPAVADHREGFLQTAPAESE
jgi:hypothetical protein